MKLYVPSPTEAGGVSVETDKATHSADAVIVTLPLGVLKAGTVRFDPVLPAWKTDAIRRLGVGHLEKVALRFSDVFWDDAVAFVGLLESRFPLFMDMHQVDRGADLAGLYHKRSRRLNG